LDGPTYLRKTCAPHLHKATVTRPSNAGGVMRIYSHAGALFSAKRHADVSNLEIWHVRWRLTKPKPHTGPGDHGPSRPYIYITSYQNEEGAS